MSNNASFVREIPKIVEAAVYKAYLPKNLAKPPFDPIQFREIIDRAREELDELEDEIDAFLKHGDMEKVMNEAGDVLNCVALAVEAARRL